MPENVISPYHFCTPRTDNPIPFLISSPHSGRLYPQDFLDLTRLPLQELRKSEDAFVDTLFENAPLYGGFLLRAELSRVFCDLNRAAWELDQDMFKESLPSWCHVNSPRVKAGMGTLHKISSTGRLIYKHYLSFLDIQHHIQNFWFPYHQKIQDFIHQTNHKSKGCVILDVHSMPSPRFRTAAYADVVLGDGFSQSCSPWLIHKSASFFEQNGLQVKKNDPYAGGYITRTYGNPKNNIHVMQIELNKSLYMNENTIQPTNDFCMVQTLLEKYMKWLFGQWEQVIS